MSITWLIGGLALMAFGSLLEIATRGGLKWLIDFRPGTMTRSQWAFALVGRTFVIAGLFCVVGWLKYR